MSEKDIQLLKQLGSGQHLSNKNLERASAILYMLTLEFKNRVKEDVI